VRDFNHCMFQKSASAYAASCQSSGNMCQAATSRVGDIVRPFDWLEEVDLVVACEVLYYVKDIRKFLYRMPDLGRACLITYHASRRAHLNRNSPWEEHRNRGIEYLSQTPAPVPIGARLAYSNQDEHRSV